MAHFLRGKQAGVQHDLSAGIAPELFAIDDVIRYGVSSQISTAAYDPVQSLLAVGTKDTQYGTGRIYIYGQKRVTFSFAPPRKASIKILQFCADKLVSVDSKNDVSVFSLEKKRMIASYAPPNLVAALEMDPTLDYALIGLQNGDIIAYDLDREALAPFKIPNFWKERAPQARLLPVVSLALHPRDVGTLLIGYSEGAVIYSFKQNKPTRFFQYDLQAGASGGSSNPTSIGGTRYPRLIQALWHPSGAFILTAHEDSSLVFWDVKDGRRLMARTLQESNIDQPGVTPSISGSRPGIFAVNQPIFNIKWCSKQNPEDTGILVAGGASSTSLTRGLTFLDLGTTPNYATSSWQVLSEHFEKPKRQHILPTPSNAEVIDYCTIPRTSPHFAASSDPIGVIVILTTGEIATLSFPSGHPISPTNQLHPSLSFVHPFVNRISLAFIDRTRWLGMAEKRSHGPSLLKGGAEAKYPLKRYENRNALQTAHGDGTVRIWDAGHGDEIENEDMLQIDVARALGRYEEVQINLMSMSGTTGELAVGLKSGEVAIFRWGHNRNYGREIAPGVPGAARLENIQDRSEPSVKEGLLPYTLLNQNSPVTALKTSDVGFVGAGFESGSFVVIDLRGPAIIFDTPLGDISKQSKRGVIRGSNSYSQGAKPEWATTMEFGVMSLEGEDYSSILLLVGTSVGRLLTFKLLPQPNGGYTVQPSGSCTLDDRVLAISPLNADIGAPAYASPSAVANLRNGLKVNGVVLAVSPSGARIFKPAVAKGASKSFDNFLCYAASVTKVEDQGYALVAMCGDGYVRAYTLPGFKQINAIRIDQALDVRRFSEAIISPTGDIFGWTGPSEIAVLNVWGTGKTLSESPDKLFNVEAHIPPRPTISNVQWITGTQYVSPVDMDILIGGPDRPPSKRMVEQMRSEEMQKRSAGRPTPPSPATGGADEGYWAYMQRQVQERTERLGIMGDSMDRLQESSSGWAEDVNSFINQQKKNAVKGGKYPLVS